MRLPKLLRRGPLARPLNVPAGFDPVAGYRSMVRMRLVDEALTQAWADGLVPGEYHSGIGEEGINAGVLAHLTHDDSVHLDHRNTAPFIGRGTDPESLMLEVLGTDQGMNGGWAGHMHLLDPDVNAACDGMVGAAGPLAVGAAVAHSRLRAGSVAVAFHGEGAVNAGMLMEAYNLAVAWSLPVLFVCKDNNWSITTHSSDVTGSTPSSAPRGSGSGSRPRAATASRRSTPPPAGSSPARAAATVPASSTSPATAPAATSRATGWSGCSRPRPPWPRPGDPA